jgi:IMP cyclohydrolase
MRIEDLAKGMEYPGRFLIVGNVKGLFISIYGVTARNESSRAKRYVLGHDNKSVGVEATDTEIMSRGNLDLLEYNALRLMKNDRLLIMGNGKQVDTVGDFEFKSVSEILDRNLQNWSFEPDKYNTPRITGCTFFDQGNFSQAVNIIRDDGSGFPRRDTYDLSTDSEAFYFLSTYAGPNTRPTPSFAGAPIQIEMVGGNIDELINEVDYAFEPGEGKADLRVAVVGVEMAMVGDVKIAIKNWS